jgi:hypothetical protein
MLALCTVFIVTCTDGLGEHGDIDEFGTRNAYLNGCSISTFVDQLFLEVERRGGRLSLVGFGTRGRDVHRSTHPGYRLRAVTSRYSAS